MSTCSLGQGKALMKAGWEGNTRKWKTINISESTQIGIPLPDLEELMEGTGTTYLHSVGDIVWRAMDGKKNHAEGKTKKDAVVNLFLEQAKGAK